MGAERAEIAQYLPAGHEVQLVEPEESWKKPAGHDRHVKDPDDAAKAPAAQFEQLVADTPPVDIRNFPGSQSAHDAIPVAG